MSRRAGKSRRSSAQAGTLAPPKERREAKRQPARSAGSRAFRRRALVADRRTRARSSARPEHLQRLIASLPSFPSLAPKLRRLPRAAWICGLIACLNAICWSIITPAFEVPDESSHYAYVAELAEASTLPRSSSQTFSQEELFALVGLGYYQIRQHPETHAPSSPAELRILHRDVRAGIENGESSSPAAGVATSEPPLYYALETIPYKLAGGTVLDRLALMRIVSALAAVLTAIFVFLFLREALPRERWAWSVGGLAAALTPVLGFVSGSVNPDSLLYAVCAAVFFCLARAFRRGLSTRGAAAIGGLIAVGTLTKLNFIGLIPGIVVGLALLTLAAVRAGAGRTAFARLALALGIGFSPALLYAAVNLITHHASLGLVSTAISEATHSSLLHQLDYTWQLFLPRLPGTPDYFPGLATTKLWFNDYVGFYGFLDTTFPSWVDQLALLPAAFLVALCGCGLWRSRTALRARVPELATYAVIALGLIALIGGASYHSFPGIDAEYIEPRYLLPLLALFAALLAIAAQGAGRRFGPAAGASIVFLFLGHDVISQLLVVGRFYS